MATEKEIERLVKAARELLRAEDGFLDLTGRAGTHGAKVVAAQRISVAKAELRAALVPFAEGL